MANIKITDLTAYGNPTSTDVLPIVDVGADVTKKVSVADLLENAGSGTAAAPGIAFDGDPNTGIYRPGADQLAISAGGTGRLFIDASGNVGLGTSSPSHLMHMYGSDPVLAVTQNPAISGNSGILLTAAGAGSAFVNFRNVTQVWHSSAGGSLFIGNGDRSTTYATISASGNVGINTTAPKTTLDCNGQLSISNSAISYWVLDRDDADGRLKFLNSSTSTNERLALDSSGRLLVGTSSESGGSLLQVNGNRIRIASSKTPASASDTGTAGEICWDSSYIYVCTATDTWKRAALSTW